MATSVVTNTAIEIIKRGGPIPDGADVRLLEASPDALSAAQQKRLEHISMAALRGFFGAAAGGFAFSSPSSLDDQTTALAGNKYFRRLTPLECMKALRLLALEGPDAAACYIGAAYMPRWPWERPEAVAIHIAHELELTNKDRFDSTLKERFGRTLAQNYPEAGIAFMRLARTYWSLKIVVDKAAMDPGGTVAEILLAQVERIIGPLFFPFPGPLAIDPARREKDQRKILREFGEGIDVEDLIRNNPILIHDRGATKA